MNPLSLLVLVSALFGSFGIPACSGPSSPASGDIECVGGATTPLGAEALERALRKHGFDARPEQDSGLCSADDIEFSLTNIHFDGPHENIDRHPEVSKREGHLGCVVRRAPLGIHRDLRLRSYYDQPPSSPVASSGPAGEFVLANVECSVYTDDPEPVARLERAMKELARGLR